MTDTLQLIKERISANKFDATRPLTEDEIRELVSYATESPSAYNIQNWRFVALTDPAAKEKLKGLSYNQQKVVDAGVTFIVLGDLRGYEKLSEIMRRTVEAGILPQPVADGWTKGAVGAYSSSEQFARDEAIRSAAFAAMTLMIAAQAKGLVSGPMIGFDPEGVKKAFNISDRYVPVMLLTVGHPAPGNFPRKPRLTVDEVLAFNEGREF
ncbi:MAG: nitroreductase family protein [Blastocatellia bacterium]|nr:nitroreductase family protein [Blastocatellia bacterium]